MEPADEIPKKKKKKGTIEFFLRSKRMKFRRIEYFSFFFFFFCKLLYSRKNARTIRIFEHSIHREILSDGTSWWHRVEEKNPYNTNNGNIKIIAVHLHVLQTIH